MRLKQKLALLLVALLALAGWPGAGMALNSIQAVDDLKASGKMSNADVNHSIVDLTNVSNGSVVAHTYIGDAETLTINNFSVLSQENSSATDKITRFMFELTNRYRPETELPLSVSVDKNTVSAYTYGTMKDEAIWAVVNGLPDCLGSPPINGGDGGGNDSSWVDQYSPDQIATTIATATFSVSSTTFTVSSVSSEPKSMVMDVAPELKDGRTFVPVRYLAYALGVDETGVSWDDNTNTASITKDKTIIKMTIGSNLLNINGKSDKMDVAPYIKDGRTMLPARHIAEPLGAKVGWDEKTQQVTLEFTKQGQ